MSENTVSNRTQIKGNVGQAPVLAQLPSGTLVLNFSLGVNGEEGTRWYEVSVYGNRANYLAGKIERGAFLAVSGTPSTREYKSKSGEDKIALKFRASWVTIIPRKDKGQAAPVEAPPTPAPALREPAEGALMDDDLPF